MRTLPPLLCALCALSVHSLFEGRCPREAPAPGVLVLARGSRLSLACSGEAMVDGERVALSRHSSVAGRERRGRATPASLPGRGGAAHTGGELDKTQKHGVRETIANGNNTRPTESAVPGEEMEVDRDSEEYQDAEEVSRVIRGMRSGPNWKWNGKTLTEVERDSGHVVLERSGGAVSLSPVGVEDSGRYSCHHRGKTLSSFKVIVAEPLEQPRLSCYKKSPSSDILCGWTPQGPVPVRPRCSLYLNKFGPPWSFSRSECSFSSGCWCALSHNEDEQRVPHYAFLCVSTSAGNATSRLLDFTPLSILKPDPPSSVAACAVEGHDRRLQVTWGLPGTWKTQDHYHALIYQISYRPVTSHNAVQEMKIKMRSYVITDALSGMEYEINIRAKDEYEGLWSEWSASVFACSWTRSSVLVSDHPSSTVYPFYSDLEGSGAEIAGAELEESAGTLWPSALVICASVSCVLLSLALAAFIVRHRKRFVSKPPNRAANAPGADPSAPAPAAAPQEGHALLTLTASRYEEPLPNHAGEEDEEQEDEGGEREEAEKSGGSDEAVHFNNTSYFLVPANV